MRRVSASGSRHRGRVRRAPAGGLRPRTAARRLPTSARAPCTRAQSSEAGVARRTREPRVEDVLAGRASADVHALVALIHAVNPTGRGLAPRDEKRRYRDKAALQSKLLREHWDHLQVVEGPPGVVALSLRATGDDAAHCPIDALDEDVRSSVRLGLDTGAWDASASGAAPAVPRAAGWAARAEAAAADYDYDAAEAVLCAARAAAPDDPAPAAALVELFVDHRFDTMGALDVFRALPPSLRAERRIASAAAVAAALGAEVALARELLGSARGERAADAWAHLGRYAMSAGDAALAREAREALAAARPADPLVAELGEHLEARRLRSRAEAEAELLAAEARGASASELEALARRAGGLPAEPRRRARAARARRGGAARARRRAPLARRRASADRRRRGGRPLARGRVARRRPGAVRAPAPRGRGAARGGAGRACCARDRYGARGQRRGGRSLPRARGGAACDRAASRAPRRGELRDARARAARARRRARLRHADGAAPPYARGLDRDGGDVGGAAGRPLLPRRRARVLRGSLRRPRQPARRPRGLPGRSDVGDHRGRGAPHALPSGARRGRRVARARALRARRVGARGCATSGSRPGRRRPSR